MTETNPTTQPTAPQVPLVWAVPDNRVMIKTQKETIDGNVFVYINRYPMLEMAMLAAQHGGHRNFNWDYEVVALGTLLDFGLSRCLDLNATQFMSMSSMVHYLDGGHPSPNLEHLKLLHRAVGRETLRSLRLELSPSLSAYTLTWVVHNGCQETVQFVGGEGFTFPVTVTHTRTEHNRIAATKSLVLTEAEWHETESVAQLTRWIQAPFVSPYLLGGMTHWQS